MANKRGLGSLLSAESFKDWYANLTNQGAHGGLVGVGLALAADAFLDPVPAWFAVVVVYGLFEVIQAITDDDDWNISWGIPDSLADLAHVAGGAAVLLCYGAWGWCAAMLAFASWCALLALETWRRIR